MTGLSEAITERDASERCHLEFLLLIDRSEESRKTLESSTKYESLYKTFVPFESIPEDGGNFKGYAYYLESQFTLQQFFIAIEHDQRKYRFKQVFYDKSLYIWEKSMGMEYAMNVAVLIAPSISFLSLSLFSSRPHTFAW